MVSDGLGGVLLNWVGEGEDAAEGARRVARERVFPCSDLSGVDCRAAGDSVLGDDAAMGLTWAVDLEGSYQPQGTVEIEVVVE